MGRKFLPFVVGILLAAAGGILITHSVVTALENDQKAARWHQDSPVSSQRPMESEADNPTWESHPKEHTRIGTLRIPSVDAEIPVFEGVSERELDRGAGRHRSVALPGEEGTTVLAGHKETAFRHLPNVEPGDRLTFTSTDQYSKRTFTYKVTKKWVTSPNDLKVVTDTQAADIRLYTCHGSQNEKRYVIQADMINN